VRFLALGDSYTIGEGVNEHERWPNQLADVLRARDVALDAPQIIARTAWTTDELLDAMDGEKPVGPYDLVSLLIGVNDEYRSRPVESFAADFQVLLRKATSLAGRKPSRVIALSIPDWGATPFAEGRDRDRISREVDAYNSRGSELAAAVGVTWADITGITRRMQHEGALVTSDGLHPSGAMYRQWAELLVPIALTALGKKLKAK
jgi:lysophospholipase L1-like esterase